MNDDVTRILSAAQAGDPRAAAELLPLVYDELRKLAANRMASERSDHTLQATALVHEAYLRLLGSGAKAQNWNGRGHFFAAAAEAMRRILVENARRRLNAKAGGGRRREGLDGLDVPAEGAGPGGLDLLALDEALARLERAEPRKAAVVKLRFFAGLTNDQAAERLQPLVYDELRKLAAQKLTAEKPGQTLQATALVHDAYLRLVGPGADGARLFRDRGHFFAAAAATMRRILIDNARRKLTRKRGGGVDVKREPLEAVAAPEPDEELLALDEALKKLAEHDPQKARLVELRYFAGLTGEQAAEAMGISPTTADRYWAYARAWLQAEVRR